MPQNGPHLQQVDDPLEGRFLADGDLNGDRLGGEPLADGVDGVLKIGAHLIHLVDKANARHAVLVGLTPDGF